MQFDLTEEQRLLRASVVDWLGAHSGPTPERGTARGDDQDRWKSFAALGWLGLPFAEEDGGFGGGTIEVGLLMHAFGAHLVTESYVSSILIAGRLLAGLGTSGQRNRLLPQVVDGTARLALAHSEPGVGWPWAERHLRASRDAA